MNQAAILSSEHPIPAHSGEPAANSPQIEALLKTLSNRAHLDVPVESLKTRFNEAKPFRHVIIDDLFDDAMLRRVLNEVPALNEDNFVVHHDEHQMKFGLRSAVALKEEGFQLAAYLHSAAFLYLISEITGIWGLLPDPYLQGGGYHVIPKGGKFDVHLDRKTDYVTGLRRRLAFITYLNEDWKPEYGGQLELWNSTGTRCEASVEPVFNRTIIFEVKDGNYHGHPNPVACPDGRSRKSFAVYYHTVSSDDNSAVDMRSSIFAPTFYSSPKQRAKALVRDLLPPLVVRGVRNIRRRAK